MNGFKRGSRLAVLMALTSSVLVFAPQGAVAETVHPAVASKAAASTSVNMFTGRKVTDVQEHEAERAGKVVIHFDRTGTNGFVATVKSGIVTHKRGAIVLRTRSLQPSMTLLPRVELKDGSWVNVSYHVDGNRIVGEFDRPIPYDQVVLPRDLDRDGLGCLLGVLGSVAAVAGGTAAIIASPATGPAAPLATVGAATGMASAIGWAAKSCGE